MQHKLQCKAHLEIKGLCADLSNCNVALNDLHMELVAAVCTLSAVDELQGKVEVLKKQTAKAKCSRTQKCEQLLAHEAVIDEKDAEITALQAL